MPIVVAIFVLAALALFRGWWWWLVGCGVGWLYFGSVFADLHPHMSDDEISQGALTGNAAIREAAILSHEQKLEIVGRTCTKVGILFGVVLFALLLTVIHWRWCWATLAAYFGCTAVRVALMLAFRAA